MTNIANLCGFSWVEEQNVRPPELEQRRGSHSTSSTKESTTSMPCCSNLLCLEAASLSPPSGPPKIKTASLSQQHDSVCVGGYDVKIWIILGYEFHANMADVKCYPRSTTGPDSLDELLD